MPFGMDLKALDVRSALDFAIGIEEDSQLRYRELAAVVAHPVRRLFLLLARREAEHQRRLEARRDVLFRHAPPRFDGSILAWEEAAGEVESPASVSAPDALDLAMEAEAKTGAFYALAALHLEDPDVRALFRELEQQEGEHHAALRRWREALSSSAVDPDLSRSARFAASASRGPRVAGAPCCRS